MRFFAKCRESPVRAFRKKTPKSVRRCKAGGGAKGGTEKVRSFVTFSYRWTPCDISFIFVISCDKLLGCFFLVFIQVGCLD